jgi:hypothetical protein
MDVNRFIIRTVLEVITELVRRLGFVDLHEKCEECRIEVEAREAAEPKG